MPGTDVLQFLEPDPCNSGQGLSLATNELADHLVEGEIRSVAIAGIEALQRAGSCRTWPRRSKG